jgi:hypothetical protein
MPPVKSGRPTALSIGITLAAVLVFYFVAYSWLSKRQVNKGPWQVLFTNDVSGTPELVIDQPSLSISNVRVRFPGETLSSTQGTGFVEFRKPEMKPPFGARIFDDLMFLPGTITLDCFGHEVELLPRVLVLNRQEVPWKSNSTNSLAASAKLPPEARKPAKKPRFGR